MNKLERVDLFDVKSGLLFLLFLFLIASLSLSWEHYRYKELTRFDDPLVRASVIDQEVRLIGDTPKTSIKIRLENGANVRCAMSPYLRDLRGREVLVELQVRNLTFLEYLKGFRTRGVIEEVYPKLSLKERWYRTIASTHTDATMQELYGASSLRHRCLGNFKNSWGRWGLAIFSPSADTITESSASLPIFSCVGRTDGCKAAIFRIGTETVIYSSLSPGCSSFICGRWSLTLRWYELLE